MCKLYNKPILILSLLAVTSCSAEKRLSRLVEHHPELKTTDTVTLRDMVPVPAVGIDTILPSSLLKSAVTMNRGRLEMTIRRDRDTIYLSGRCKADTIVRTLRVPVERIRVVAGSGSTVKWTLIAIIVMVVTVVTVVTIVKKRE